MTSALAIIGLTFDGIDIQNLDGIYLELTGGLNDSPAVRGVDVIVPGAAGQVARPRRFHERRILLTGSVRGSGSTEDDRRAAYRTDMKTLLALFDTAANPADLVAELEDSTTGTIAARTLSVLSTETVPSEEAAISIELLAVEDWSFA